LGGGRIKPKIQHKQKFTRKQSRLEGAKPSLRKKQTPKLKRGAMHTKVIKKKSKDELHTTNTQQKGQKRTTREERGSGNKTATSSVKTK